MSPDPQPPLPREVRVLVAVAFFVALGFGIVAPALPVFARDFGVGRAAAGAVISAFAFMRIAFALSGRASGRPVRRAASCSRRASGSSRSAALLPASRRAIAELIVLRGIGGVGSAMFSISALSLLVRHGPELASGVARWGSGRAASCSAASPARCSAVSSRGSRSGCRSSSTPARWSMAGTTAVVALRATPLADKRRCGDELAHDAGAGAAESGLPRRVGRELRRLVGRDRGPLGADPAVRRRRLAQAGDLHRHRLPDRVGGQRRDAAAGRPVRRPRRPQAGARDRMPGQRDWDRGARDLAGPGRLLSVGLALLGFGSGLLDVAPGAVVGDIVEGRGGPVFAAYTMSSDVGTVFGPVVAGRIADASYSAAFGMTAGILGVAAVFAAFAPETLNRAGPTAERGGVAQSTTRRWNVRNDSNVSPTTPSTSASEKPQIGMCGSDGVSDARSPSLM